MKRRRVKITGIGPVTPAGIGREAFWKGILEPVSRVRAYGKFGEEFGPFVAAYVSNFEIGKYVSNRGELPKGTARHTLFAVSGAFLALGDAGISSSELQRTRCAVVTGSSLLDFGGIGGAIEAVHRKGVRAAQARVVFTTTLTSVVELVSKLCGVTSRTMAIQTSCCSGLDAIGRAAQLISTGEVDIAICGGTECPIHRFPMLELRSAGLTPPTEEMADRIARPFDLWRTTGVVSEGACMFVLEPESSPRQGYSYISGYGFANDHPESLCSGMIESTRLALAEAHLRPSQIECINAWGPGHRLVDEGEARSMYITFGDKLPEIPVFSIKGAIGSALGAAPAIQVAVAALSQRSGLMPPTVNWNYPDPACPLNLCNKPRAISNRSMLINAHGVGSVNASMIVEQC